MPKKETSSRSKTAPKAAAPKKVKALDEEKRASSKPSPKAKASKAAEAAKTVKSKAVKAVASAAENVKKAVSRATSEVKTPRGKPAGAPKSTAGKKKPAARSKAATEEREIRPETEIRPTSPTDVREHYFQEHRAPQFTPEPRDLPIEYGDTRIVLLVRDPEWLFSYWEINDATREELRLPRTGHNRRVVLRMYKIDGRNWPEESAHYFFDVDVGPYANNWYIKIPEPDSRWCGELGMYDEEGNYIVIARSNAVATPPDRMSDETDSEWMLVEEEFQKIYGLSGGYALKEMRGSEMLLRQLQKQIMPGLRGEQLSSGALFSGRLAVPPDEVAKDFWLQVHTELILYGATEPGSRLTVQSRPVRLNPDGTFSLRFFLPDGEQVLEVKATNSDGDLERKITPIVTKRTG
jgi:uncharacterized protein